MGILSSIGDALGGAVDFVGDNLGGIADVATSFIPGPFDDLAVDAIGGIAGSLTGGGGAQTMGGGGAPPLFGPGGVISPSPVDMGPAQFNTGAAMQFLGSPGNTKPNGMMTGGDFNNALMMQLVKGSVRSSAGRAVFEAMASGSLQAGIIQPTVTVNTPRGVENHSPPGFRTVYVNGDPYAVFKPVAKTLGLLPKTSKAKITAADMKAITKADRLAKTIKRLGQRTGRLKITNK